MNFDPIPLSDGDMEFWLELRALLDELVTEEVLEQERRTGSGHCQPLHEALGRRGLVLSTWPRSRGGAGLTRLREYLLERELLERDVPTVTRTTTLNVALTLDKWGSEHARGEILPRVAAGHVCICLGYTEPESGSDMAAARCRAVRDGDSWLVTGQKMFTTGAQHCQYSFVLARTDQQAPKHRGLTMFLVPLQTPQVEVQAVRTLSGERSNIVFYDGARVPDTLRVGPVNAGWTTVNDAVAAEHGIIDDSPEGIPPTDFGGRYDFELRRLLDDALRWATEAGPDGRRPIDDPAVRRRLAQASVDYELALSTPGHLGRVSSSLQLIHWSSEFLDMVGPAGCIPRGRPGAVLDGRFEWWHRFAQGTAIYGGTTDIFRTMIAQRDLGLPRPPR
jgi:alkylation response protein AidB-like acyl-CoA dehydrogenase